MNYQAVSRLLATKHQHQLYIGSTSMWKFRKRISEVECVLCQYEDKWKREHPELYPLTPGTPGAWSSYADDLSGRLTLLETKAVLKVDIVRRNDFTRNGFQVEKTMIFELTPEQSLDMFGDHIEAKVFSVADDEYERRERARIKLEQESILAEMLSEAATLDCDWDNA